MAYFDYDKFASALRAHNLPLPTTIDLATGYSGKEMIHQYGIGSVHFQERPVGAWIQRRRSKRGKRGRSPKISFTRTDSVVDRIILPLSARLKPPGRFRNKYFYKIFFPEGTGICSGDSGSPITLTDPQSQKETLLGLVHGVVRTQSYSQSSIGMLSSGQVITGEEFMRHGGSRICGDIGVFAYLPKLRALIDQRLTLPKFIGRF